MSLNPSQELLQISQTIRILYVEDDEDLRNETHLLLKNFFNHIDLAFNGVHALAYYDKHDYDIIITDIKMPEMDGVSLIEEVFKCNKEQAVVVTSAHDDSHILVNLINLGVNYFLLKPLNLPNFISSLYKICKQIRTEQDLERYTQALESKNKELLHINVSLGKAVRALENRYKTKEVQTLPPVEPHAPKSETFTSIKEYMIDTDIAELMELEGDIDSLSVIMLLNKRIEEHKLEHLIFKLGRYGSILTHYPLFNAIGSHISDLSRTLEKTDISNIDEARLINFLTLLESFVTVLLKWRSELFEDKLDDPNAYDSSLISDLQTMVNILTYSDDEVVSSEDELDEIEFF